MEASEPEKRNIDEKEFTLTKFETPQIRRAKWTPTCDPRLIGGIEAMIEQVGTKVAFERLESKLNVAFERQELKVLWETHDRPRMGQRDVEEAMMGLEAIVEEAHRHLLEGLRELCKQYSSLEPEQGDA